MSSEFKDGFEDIIRLGIDGNCVFALLGNSFEDGQSEFHEITQYKNVWSDKWVLHVKRKAVQAGVTLCRRLGIKHCKFSFDDYIDPECSGSH